MNASKAASASILQAVHFEQAEALDGKDLRRHFVIEGLFEPGRIVATYTHYDRMLLLGITPVDMPLELLPEHAELVGATDVLERRELGLINIGGPGRIRANGQTYDVGYQDGVYLGMGSRDVSFESLEPTRPAPPARDPAFAVHAPDTIAQLLIHTTVNASPPSSGPAGSARNT